MLRVEDFRCLLSIKLWSCQLCNYAAKASFFVQEYEVSSTSAALQRDRKHYVLRMIQSEYRVRLIDAVVKLFQKLLPERELLFQQFNEDFSRLMLTKFVTFLKHQENVVRKTVTGDSLAQHATIRKPFMRTANLLVF